MENKFQIIIGSPIDYEELVAYVWINGEEIAIVQKEEGVNRMKVEFFKEKVQSDIYLDTLLAALFEAKSQLMK
ncbi:hypothetical protein [Dyadobacter sp. CY323]|uniref:hypothetical protein n=1 Tax=Dyadobacter sp. CY323 TaxID=2907302 RepID=UPI001F1CCF8E|nr:hypothetical protein [Dyadobacter sp. CY323]MCE6988870.1 hypothetical protein [Dyadobacter sp. CY323]